jgi:hypothetical protein
MSHSAPVLRVAPGVEVIGSEVGTPLSPALIVSAAEDATFAWASVVITDGFIPGDHLAADAGGTRIAANYDSATGVLTLTGADTLAHYQQALRTVRYWRTGGDADHRVARARDIAWQVSDGVAWSVPQVTNLTIVAKPEPRPGTTGPAGAQTTPSGSASGSPRVSPRNPVSRSTCRRPAVVRDARGSPCSGGTLLWIGCLHARVRYV